MLRNEYKQANAKYKLLTLKSQRQIWDILQGISSLEVEVTRNFLAWYDK